MQWQCRREDGKSYANKCLQGVFGFSLNTAYGLGAYKEPSIGLSFFISVDRTVDAPILCIMRMAFETSMVRG